MTKQAQKKRDEFNKLISKEVSLEDQNCFICESDHFKIISLRDRYGFYYPTGICNECGSVQQTKYYSDELLVTFYSKFYREIYGEISPKELYKYQKYERAPLILDITSKIINPKTVLEIGCGAGGNLAVFQENGSNVLGLDFDNKYLDHARKKGISVKLGSFESIQEGVKFDMIILSHVLEHIVNPKEFLSKLTPHMSKDSIIYIEVPSLENVSDGGFSYDLLNYFQNAHTIHFTESTLHLLCKQIGLECVTGTNFIRSCWKLSDKSNLSEYEKNESLQHSVKLLNKIECNRRRLLNQISIRLSYFRSLLIKMLIFMGLKNYIANFYRKLRIYLY